MVAARITTAHRIARRVVNVGSPIGPPTKSFSRVVALIIFRKYRTMASCETTQLQPFLLNSSCCESRRRAIPGSLPDLQRFGSPDFNRLQTLGFVLKSDSAA